MLDIWLSGNGMVLSEIWCPRKKSTNFGTFDLLSLICVRVQAYLSKGERTNLFWYAFEVGEGYLTKFKFRLLILVIRSPDKIKNATDRNPVT